MGGEGDPAYDCAVEITRGWERHENFELYDDVLGTLAAIRAAGLKIGLVSNSARDVREFARHHGLDVDAGISSFHHGRTKPHASIFRAVLDLLAVQPAEAAMVGDMVADDVEGARAVGMHAILLDREGLQPDFEPRIESLAELPGLLLLDGVDEGLDDVDRRREDDRRGRPAADL
jgi:HAD superfamily hydrolase (TIGR01662 family)